MGHGAQDVHKIATAQRCSMSSIIISWKNELDMIYTFWRSARSATLSIAAELVGRTCHWCPRRHLHEFLKPGVYRQQRVARR